MHVNAYVVLNVVHVSLLSVYLTTSLSVYLYVSL